MYATKKSVNYLSKIKEIRSLRSLEAIQLNLIFLPDFCSNFMNETTLRSEINVPPGINVPPRNFEPKE